MNIEQNLLYIKNEIRKTLKNSKRNLEDVTIIGVTKTIDVTRIQELVDLGIKDLGENKVQELLDKYDKIDGDINWHFIGHLQRNKVKYIIDKVKMIHSVDSLKLAQEINRQAEKHDIIMDILIQVNIGEEESKFGIKINQVEEFIKNVHMFEKLRIKGLMCIAPNTNNEEKLRNLFSNLYKKYIDILDKTLDNKCSHLSMGMSNDYKIAIEEGSNMIRVGTSVFGAR